ncbi:Hypothetical predicted protein, partial [Pelobates cultripes]
IIVDCTYTFAYIYSPNRRQHTFLTRTLTKLQKFQEGLLILAGNLDIALDPQTDASRGTSTLSQHCICSAQAALHGWGLVDCWRVAHPEDRDFTYYSLVHKQYSHIDYVFVAQEYLPLVLNSDIGIFGTSDHAPVSAQFKSPLYKPSDRQWKFNENLLTNPDDTAQTKQVLTQYFDDNARPEVPPRTIWEACKFVIRGHYINICSQRKKEHTNHISEKELRTIFSHRLKTLAMPFIPPTFRTNLSDSEFVFNIPQMPHD